VRVGASRSGGPWINGHNNCLAAGSYEELERALSFSFYPATYVHADVSCNRPSHPMCTRKGKRRGGASWRTKSQRIPNTVTNTINGGGRRPIHIPPHRHATTTDTGHAPRLLPPLHRAQNYRPRAFARSHPPPLRIHPLLAQRHQRRIQQEDPARSWTSIRQRQDIGAGSEGSACTRQSASTL
jgi:hypothetical protein